MPGYFVRISILGINLLAPTHQIHGVVVKQFILSIQLRHIVARRGPGRQEFVLCAAEQVEGTTCSLRFVVGNLIGLIENQTYLA